MGFFDLSVQAMTGRDNGHPSYLDLDTCHNFDSDICPGWDLTNHLGIGVWGGKKRGWMMGKRERTVDDRTNLDRLSSIVLRLSSIVSRNQVVLQSQGGSFGAVACPQLGEDAADVHPDG